MMMMMMMMTIRNCLLVYKVAIFSTVVYSVARFVTHGFSVHGEIISAIDRGNDCSDCCSNRLQR